MSLLNDFMVCKSQLNHGSFKCVCLSLELSVARMESKSLFQILNYFVSNSVNSFNDQPIIINLLRN